MGKVLEARVDQYVNSLYHAVTISNGKVVRKRTLSSMGIQGELYKVLAKHGCSDEPFVFSWYILEKVWGLSKGSKCLKECSHLKTK